MFRRLPRMKRTNTHVAYTTLFRSQQGIDGLLQHALLVAQDDVGRFEFEQAPEAIVAVDDATIQVVQVGRGETAAVERHQWTQIGRQHRSEEHTSELQSLMRI